MEFHEKLQELRKRKGITQEELAEKLYVSRTAVSKWESGRGYPNIDSLKAIAGFFAVTVDELLSGDELLGIAEEEHEQKEKRLRAMVFALLDLSSVMLLLLPLFGEKAEGMIRSVSLLSLRGGAPYMRAAYLALVLGMTAWGSLMLALHFCRHPFWEEGRNGISLLLSGLGVLLFIIGQQPYAAVLLFVFLAVKGVLLAKR